MIGIAVACRAGVLLAARGRVTSVEAAPAADVALVLGAGLRADGQPGPVLAARVRAGVALWQAGKVRQLVLSGGDGEPEAMARLARSLGVPERALRLDGGGTRTVESCRRARGLGRVLVVTQGFHLPRALYLCRGLGVEARGVQADDPGAGVLAHVGRQAREAVAGLVAVAEVAAAGGPGDR